VERHLSALLRATMQNAAGCAHRRPRLHMLVDPPRVHHVPEHDLAHLQRGLAETDLQDLDVAALRQ
jgi:hypothetical protein